MARALLLLCVMKKPLTVADAMTRVPFTVGADAKLIAAHRTMNRHRVRHLPVVDHGELVGILTQRDLYFLETIRGVDAEEDVVKDAMSPDAYAVAPTTPLANVVKTMVRKRYGCAVVMKRGKVEGIFTTTDALRLLSGFVAPRPS